MKIGGLEKMTLIDFPGQVSAIVFTVACNFRCHFCYNPLLVWPAESSESESVKNTESHSLNNPSSDLTEDYCESGTLSFLESRRGKLDGVVITGGEPTLHADLPDFIKKIKKLGYKVKLDTNGTNPDMIKQLIKGKLLDYLAMDLKAPRERYFDIVGVASDWSKIGKSVKIIMKSGLPYEFRTTVVKKLLNSEDIAKMGQIIKGADKWYLQKFKPDTDLVNPTFKKEMAYTSKEMQALADIGSKYVKKCEWR